MEPVRVEEEETTTANNAVPTTASSLVPEDKHDSLSFLSMKKSMAGLSLNESRHNSPVKEVQLLPPINRNVLQELDSSVIEGNVQIMHDLYLEPNLKIQPNKRNRSAMSEQVYWTHIEQDFKSLHGSIAQGVRGRCPPSIRALLKEIRDIMADMHPESKRVQDELYSVFDLDLLVSELECGHFDLGQFGQVFADLLQTNCAPKRDKAVMKLRLAILQGDFIEYLRECLSLLELMKIDLVNYRFSKLRPEMANKLVELERKHFIKLNCDMRDTTGWMKRCLKACEGRDDEKIYSAFSRGLAELVVGIDDEDAASLPETFLLDRSRMARMRTEAQDICIVALTLNVQKQILGRSHNTEELKKALFDLLQADQADTEDVAKILLDSVEPVKKLPPSQIKAINGMMNSIVCPDGKLFTMLQGRLSNHLVDRLWKRETPIPGFEGVEVELKEFVASFTLIALANWHIHQETYARIANS